MLPREFVDAHKRLRMQKNPATKWTIVTQSYTSITYEWLVVDEPSVGDYHEIARIVRGENGLHVFHYATKNASLSWRDRSDWTSTLNRLDFDE